MTKHSRKLALKLETLQSLQPDKLTAVAGGAPTLQTIRTTVTVTTVITRGEDCFR